MNPKYNLFVIVKNEIVLRCENNISNRITIKGLFDKMDYKLLIKSENLERVIYNP
jgi:hypothetical protein